MIIVSWFWRGSTVLKKLNYININFVKTKWHTLIVTVNFRSDWKPEVTHTQHNCCIPIRKPNFSIFYDKYGAKVIGDELNRRVDAVGAD